MTDKDALGAALDSACDGLVDEVATMIGANGMERRALRYAEAEMRNRLASIDLPTPPQPFDAAGIEYGDAAQDAVMRLLETGWATVNSAGYLARALPEAPASVEPEPPEIEQVYIAQGINADGGPPWNWYVVGPEGEVAYCQTEDGENHAHMIAVALNDRVHILREDLKKCQAEPDTIGSHPPTSGGGDLREAIRALPYDVMDDYDEVRRDERERIINHLQKKDDAQWFTTPNGTGLAAMKRAEQAIGAAISNGSLQSVERAYNILRDLIDQAIRALPIPEAPASVEPVEAKYLICKGGAYYRPDAQGYTRNKAEAGRYTLEQAISYSHPNGPYGPRDGITYELDTAPPSPGFGGGDLREADSILRELVEAVNHASWSDNGAVEKAMTRAAEYVIDHPPLAALSHDQRGGAGEPESHEKRARRLFDEMARNIGREAVNYLKTMYPEMISERGSVSKSWETSMVNHVRNDINWRMRPLLMAMIAMHQEWEAEHD